MTSIHDLEHDQRRDRRPEPRPYVLLVVRGPQTPSHRSAKGVYLYTPRVWFVTGSRDVGEHRPRRSPGDRRDHQAGHPLQYVHAQP